MADQRAEWEARMAANNDRHEELAASQQAEVARFIKNHTKEVNPGGGHLYRPQPGWTPIDHGSIVQRH